MDRTNSILFVIAAIGAAIVVGSGVLLTFGLADRLSYFVGITCIFRIAIVFGELFAHGTRTIHDKSAPNAPASKE